MRAYVAIALSAALISSAGAETNDISANYKLPGCRDFINRQLTRTLVQDPSRLFRAALCGGEIDGIANTLEITGQTCPPHGVTYEQIDAVVMNWSASLSAIMKASRF
jgi:hypothetical protein